MKHRFYKTFRYKTKEMDEKINGLVSYGWNIKSFAFVNNDYEVVVLAYRFQTTQRKKL